MISNLPKSDFVWLDGELIPWAESKVHLLTHSLHYGLGVFEGTRAYRQTSGGTAIFRLEEHLRRLEQSAHIVQLPIPFDRPTLAEASKAMVARNGFDSCYLRHLVFLGAGAMGLLPKDNPVRVAILAWPWGTYLGEEGLARGIRCKVSSFTRPFANSSMNKAKVCGNYVNSILAKREAVADGYAEAILLDVQGFVAEGSGENLFMVRDGVIKTPPLTHVLEGITRATMIQLAEDLGMAVREANITRDELYVADEIFLTGTAAEVTPVREVDGRKIGVGEPGPVTRKLQERFFGLIQGEISDYDHWLHPVRVPAATRTA